MRLSDYYYDNEQNKLSKFECEGVYITRRYFAHGSPFDIDGSNFCHVYKVGMSKNLSRRVLAYIDTGYSPFEIVLVPTPKNTAREYERFLKNFFARNSDTAKYRGNEWYIVEAYYNQIRDVTNGATAADALFKAIGRCKEITDGEVLEWCASFNHLLPGMNLSTDNVKEYFERVGGPISINDLAWKYQDCKLYRATKGHALYQIVDLLQEQGVVKQLEDKPYWFCHGNSAHNFIPGLADYDQIPQITPLVGAQP